MAVRLPRVLVVEDDDGLRSSLGRVLTANGFRPALAATAEDALPLLEASEVDVVLADLRLPGMDGHALLRVLQRAGAALPVILMSGQATMEDTILAVRERAVDFLCKPFPTEALVAALERAVAALPAAPPEAGARASAPVAPEPPPSPPVPEPPLRPGAPEPQRAAEPALSLSEAFALVRARLRDGTVRLPVLDDRTARVQELLEKPGCGVEEVLSVVGADPALAAVVLRAANSSYFNPGTPIADLRQACVQLGNRRVVSFALEAQLQAAFACQRQPFRAILMRLWRNAFVTARAADRLARTVHRSRPELRPELPNLDSLYVAALLHNIGEILLLQLLSELDALPAPDPDDLGPLADGLARLHEELGAQLARTWALPPLVVRLAGRHHAPTAPGETGNQRNTRALVGAAWRLALEAGFTYLPGQETESSAEERLILGIDDHEADAMRAEMARWLRPAGAD